MSLGQGVTAGRGPTWRAGSGRARRVAADCFSEAFAIARAPEPQGHSAPAGRQRPKYPAHNPLLVRPAHKLAECGLCAPHLRPLLQRSNFCAPSAFGVLPRAPCPPCPGAAQGTGEGRAQDRGHRRSAGQSAAQRAGQTQSQGERGRIRGAPIVLPPGLLGRGSGPNTLPTAIPRNRSWSNRTRTTGRCAACS